MPIQKLVPCFHVGRRTWNDAQLFINDLHQRIISRPQITTDMFKPYYGTIMQAFGNTIDYAQLHKVFASELNTGRGRYSPPVMVDAEKEELIGHPDPAYISTSYVERQNLSVRMECRRFTRLTNAFSKKLANLKASVAFHYAHYNFVRVHRTLRCTPAMTAGVTDRLWSVEELIHHRNQWLMGQAMSGRKKRPEKHQRDTQTGQSKTQPHHPVGSINPCQHSDRHTQKRKDDQSMPDSLANKIIAGGTILLGIVGIGGLLLTYWSISQTADSVAAAKAAANAAQAANELTLENISP